MTETSRISSGPATVKANISLVEERMIRRRVEIGGAMTSAADKLRDRAVSAWGLATAMLLGIFLERYQRHHPLSPKALLRPAAGATIWPLLILAMKSGIAPLIRSNDEDGRQHRSNR